MGFKKSEPMTGKGMGEDGNGSGEGERKNSGDHRMHVRSKDNSLKGI